VVVGLPLIAVIWLIARVIGDRDRIEELARRVEQLHSELARLKQTAPPPHPAREEKAAAFTAATLPPRRMEPEPAAPIPPVPEAVVAETVATIMPPTPVPIPEPAPAAGPDLPPPLIVPPLPTPPAVPAEPLPEPVLETARTSAGASAETTPDAAAKPPSLPEKASFEMRLGTFWLVRVGLVMVLTAFGFFVNYAYHNIIGKLGPAGKISLLYLASGLLLGAGAWWQRRNARESLKHYAQVLFAGGLAAVYFTTYAAHYAPPVRVIQSMLLDGALLFAWAGLIAWIADRRKSEVMALFAVGLAFFTSVITRVGEFTLYSNLILTITAVVFLLRNRWAGLSFASLIASYTGYVFWRFLREDGWRWATADENLLLGAGFLACYWLVFTAATFLSKSEQLTGPRRALFLTLNNGTAFALFLLTMLQVHTGGFWKVSLGFGTVLLGLAALARKLLPAEPLAKNSYLTQGLLLVTLGFITKFTGLQLALVLGAECVLLYVPGAQQRKPVLKFFAYATALLAAGWCVMNLNQFDQRGLWTAAGLGALLAFNAFWAHRMDRGDHEDPALIRTEPATFTLLALFVWLAATWFNTTPSQLPLVLAVEAVALTFSIYLLRVREITLFGQGFLILAQAAWLWRCADNPPPWWNPLALIAVTIGLSHWWQHQKVLVIHRNFFAACSGLFALAVVAVALEWLHPLVTAPTWLALTSLLAVAATAYGLVTRVWALAIGGQIFLAVSIWEFLQQLLRDRPEWYFPLAPIAVLALLSFGALGWFARQPEADHPARQPLLQLAMIYRWLALAMSLLWISDYAPERQQVWACMLAAAAVFALALWRSSREALLAAAVYAMASLARLWIRDNLAMDLYWPNLLSLLALLGLQQTLRRAAARLPLDENTHGAVVILACGSLWRFISCWDWHTGIGGVSMTMTWAGFAVAVFVIGIFLRERFFRWFGLGVLAASVGRVVLVDVWNQPTLYRVLTFLALGLALLMVGFIYNKYQETIRRWL
jgi:uncharacterized membrane protein